MKRRRDVYVKTVIHACFLPSFLQASSGVVILSEARGTRA